MQWKAYLDGENFEFRILQGLVVCPEVAIRADLGGWYLTGRETEDFTEAVQAKEWAESWLPRLVALGRLEVAHFGSVKFSGRVQREGESYGTVFAEGRSESYSRVTAGTPDTELLDRISSLASADEDYDGALKLVGLAPALNWVVLYKVYELLRQSAGGDQPRFRARSGWTKQQESSFTGSANHPDVSGTDARHAVPQSRKAPNSTMTLATARELVLATLRRWPDSR